MILNTTNNYTFQIDEADYEKVSKYTWTKSPDGYIKKYREENKNGKRVKRWVIHQHRYIIDAKVGEIVDHINGDTADNRRSNLRIVDRSVNALNTEKTRGAIPYRGVIFNKQVQKYQARISINKKSYHLGFYNTAIEAHKSYELKRDEVRDELQLYNKQK